MYLDIARLIISIQKYLEQLLSPVNSYFREREAWDYMDEDIAVWLNGDDIGGEPKNSVCSLKAPVRPPEVEPWNYWHNAA